MGKAINKIICGIILLVLIFSMTGCTFLNKEKNIEPVIAEGLPEFSVEGETSLPGNFYLSFVNDRSIIMLDGKGNIVWSKHENQPKEDVKTGWLDFKKTICDGVTYYSYHDQTGTYDNYGIQDYAPGERVILDNNFNEIARIKLTKTDTVQEGDPLDGHDFIMLGMNHYILSSYRKERIYNNPKYPSGTNVVYSYLQEVKDGNLVWEWKSIDYPELYDLAVTDAEENANDFANIKTSATDYIHFNSMQVDGKDGNLICSFENINTIMKIDRNTGDIIWKLSGNGDEFNIDNIQKTSSQHYANITKSGYITCFNNGNSNKETTITKYKIDEYTKTIQDVYQYNFDHTKYSISYGSAQELSDTIWIIGWGYSTKDNTCLSVYDVKQGKSLMNINLENPMNHTDRCVYYK